MYYYVYFISLIITFYCLLFTRYKETDISHRACWILWFYKWLIYSGVLHLLCVLLLTYCVYFGYMCTRVTMINNWLTYYSGYRNSSEKEKCGKTWLLRVVFSFKLMSKILRLILNSYTYVCWYTHNLSESCKM